MCNLYSITKGQAATLADLDGADKVGRVHFAEALSYRSMADEIRHAA